MAERVFERYKDQITGAAGAAAGLIVAELPSEFSARATGLTGAHKAGLKTVIKIIIGILAYSYGKRARAPWDLFAKVMAYAGWGSIVIDWISAYYAGGIAGIAERLAVTVRVWAFGAKSVATQLKAMERATPTETPIKQQPSISRVGKYA